MIVGFFFWSRSFPFIEVGIENGGREVKVSCCCLG